MKYYPSYKLNGSISMFGSSNNVVTVFAVEVAVPYTERNGQVDSTAVYAPNFYVALTPKKASELS